MSAWVYILDSAIDKKFSAKERLILMLGGPEHIARSRKAASPTGEGAAHFFQLTDAGEDLFEARRYSRPEWRRLDRRPKWDSDQHSKSGFRRLLPW